LGVRQPLPGALGDEATPDHLPHGFGVNQYTIEVEDHCVAHEAIFRQERPWQHAIRQYGHTRLCQCYFTRR
jgi:hypothetical protein